MSELLMLERRSRPEPIERASTERLAFELPDFTREPAWVSQAAKDVWAPRLARITAAWAAIERASVGRIRHAALVFVGPAEIVELRQWATRQRLMVLPVAFEGSPGPVYAASSTALLEGEPWRMRTVLCDPMYGATAQRAYLDGDEEAIGELLGYPACCTRFYRQIWVEEHWRDTTWPMAIRTAGAEYYVTRARAEGAGEPHADPCLGRDRVREERILIAGAPIESNILLRWLGLRLVPHLPCSLACAATAGSGRAYAQLGRELGYVDEMDWLEEILAWPVEWSALHGITEVKTPVFKFSARSDATAHKVAVQREGTRFPDVGATGVAFPFRLLPKRPVSDSRAFQAGVAHLTPADNGFASLEAERAAHTVVLRAAAALVDVAGDVLDLGCGNGQLVAQICRDRTDRTACGVELQVDRAARAAVALGKDNVTIGAIAGAWPRSAPYGIICIMPGRLLEVDATTRSAIAARILEATDHVLVYAYGDWLVRDSRGLAGLVSSAFGDRLELGKLERGDAVEAAPAKVKR